ncbi:hypothetical protein NL676_021604 [Syzygium grande]|nr:hypothetical protein NL676_021604 [Syzygium grande]
MVVCGKDPSAQSSSQPRRDCGGSQERVAGHKLMDRPRQADGDQGRAADGVWGQHLGTERRKVAVAHCGRRSNRNVTEEASSRAHEARSG